MAQIDPDAVKRLFGIKPLPPAGSRPPGPPPARTKKQVSLGSETYEDLLAKDPHIKRIIDERNALRAENERLQRENNAMQDLLEKSK